MTMKQVFVNLVNTPLPSTALSDFMVLDLTRVRSGPTCVRQLADWGADVIKIEAQKTVRNGWAADWTGFPKFASKQAEHDAQSKI